MPVTTAVPCPSFKPGDSGAGGVPGGGAWCRAAKPQAGESAAATETEVCGTAPGHRATSRTCSCGSARRRVDVRAWRTRAGARPAATGAATATAEGQRRRRAATAAAGGANDRQRVAPDMMAESRGGGEGASRCQVGSLHIAVALRPESSTPASPLSTMTSSASCNGETFNDARERQAIHRVKHAHAATGRRVICAGSAPRPSSDDCATTRLGRRPGPASPAPAPGTRA